MKQQKMAKILEACAKRGAERRQFLRMAGGAGVAVTGGSLLAGCGGGDDGNMAVPTPTPTGSPTPTPTPSITDGDILNFALNLEYLEAQFYAFATTGEGIPSEMLTGIDTQGVVAGGAQVDFSGDALVGQYAREIARDERNHVAFLRKAIGDTAVAMPTIDLRADPEGAFSAAAVAAGLIEEGDSFDPFGSPENFLLAAFIFEDVGVTAYKGAAPLISESETLEAAAGILSAEAYHAGLVRTILYRKGVAMPDLGLIEATESISGARDSLDGDTDLDQGIGGSGDTTANLVPSNDDAIIFGRDAAQVLNIVYLDAMASTGGGFFPNGVNGAIAQSAGDEPDG